MRSPKEHSLLQHINSPEDVKKIKRTDLTRLCLELRQFIIDQVSRNGGHFGASLGVVELTVALHYVFQTPYDQLVWDVGHQAYGHKILTGRRDQFATNRVLHGISGFPKRLESAYDAFGTGHSSTSISAVLGMAIASKLKGESTKQHIAVIGDGALTAGISFEAMNHAGVSDTNILIIVNDNNMSIDPNVGALQQYLNEQTSVSNSHNGKGNNFFEDLGLKYTGPVDGHDVENLVRILHDLKHTAGPKVLHVRTRKGKGYPVAESDQTLWHAPGLFDKITGKIHQTISDLPQPPKYQDVFGKTLLELARKNPKIMGVTPAMASGSSLKFMMEEMPDRALDVGIAEQHAVTLSAGLTTQGMKVFCAIYSTFLQRAYDMVIHDVALQNLPVVFCLDRAGLVGEDGATHQGAFDLAVLRCIPNMIVSAPMNEQELRNLLFTAQLDEIKNPFSIRYPRGKGVMPAWETPFEKIEIGKGRLIKEGKDVAILTIGHPGNFAIEACVALQQEGIDAAHYDLRFVKPLDEALLRDIAQQFSKVITVEDGTILGGFGSAIVDFFNAGNDSVQVKVLGIPDHFIEQGTQAQQYAECGFDVKGIVQAAKAFMDS